MFPVYEILEYSRCNVPYRGFPETKVFPIMEWMFPDYGVSITVFAEEKSRLIDVWLGVMDPQ